MRQSCTQLRKSVDHYCHSVYFTREQWLDIRRESIRNVSRILKNFGKFVRCLKVGEEGIKPNLLLDVIDSTRRGVLKGLTLDSLHLHKIEIEIFARLFHNLTILEVIYGSGDRKVFENILLKHQYPNLTTLTVKKSFVQTEILRKFFMRPRIIKKLDCYVDDGLLLPKMHQR